jgi:translation initiation factor IF-2
MRQEKARQVALASAGSRRMTFEALAQDIGKGEVKELPIVLKSDVQGSIEALRAALADVPQEKIKINVLRSSTGAITPSDVTLAMASNAVIVGFNVRPERAASDLAKQEGVEIRQYTVIYDVVDDIRQVMVGMLEPVIKETILGQCEVRQLFRVPKVGVIAGCYVTDGKLTRGAEIRLIRDNVLIYTGRVGSLKRFKDDVSEVKSGYECGVGIHNYNDLKEGDVLEFFVKEKVAAESL